MSDMPANNIKELVASYTHRERPRSPQEVLARYNQALMAYKELCFTSGDVREQKLTTYNEIKILGWVLGKAEKNIIKDIGEHSNKMFYGAVLD
ncbi:MAG: hypothetical protein IK062_11505 [Selenomonadaceae bacterium]|nr:hypothetical protein [Selenomonadaceae bacterium]